MQLQAIYTLVNSIRTSFTITTQHCNQITLSTHNQTDKNRKSIPNPDYK